MVEQHTARRQGLLEAKGHESVEETREVSEGGYETRNDKWKRESFWYVVMHVYHKRTTQNVESTMQRGNYGAKRMRFSGIIDN